MGYYKPANQSGGCSPCPANSNTGGEGSEQCHCLQGFSRLPTDPEHLGCTGKKCFQCPWKNIWFFLFFFSSLTAQLLIYVSVFLNVIYLVFILFFSLNCIVAVYSNKTIMLSIQYNSLLFCLRIYINMWDIYIWWMFTQDAQCYFTHLGVYRVPLRKSNDWLGQLDLFGPVCSNP